MPLLAGFVGVSILGETALGVLLQAILIAALLLAFRRAYFDLLAVRDRSSHRGAHRA
jgi:hypothetical protein